MSPEYNPDDELQYNLPSRRENSQKPPHRTSRTVARPTRRANKPEIGGKHQRRNKHWSW